MESKNTLRWEILHVCATSLIHDSANIMPLEPDIHMVEWYAI